MPTGAAQPLIDVFQGLLAQKERRSEFQQEMSAQQLRDLAQQHYEAARLDIERQQQERLAKSQEDIERHRLAQEREWSDIEKGRMATEQRLQTQAEGKTVQDRLKDWGSATSAIPAPVLMLGLTPEQQTQFQSGIQDWVQARYNTKLQAEQQDATRRAEERINLLPNPMGEAVAFGAVSGVPVPPDYLKQIAQIHYEEQQNALKNVGPAPGPDAWKTAVPPGVEQAQDFKRAQIEHIQAQTEVLNDSHKRNEVLLQFLPDQQRATINKLNVAAEAAQKKWENDANRLAFQKKYQIGLLTVAENNSISRRMEAKASLSRAAASEYSAYHSEAKQMANKQLEFHTKMYEKAAAELSAANFAMSKTKAMFENADGSPKVVNRKGADPVTKTEMTMPMIADKEAPGGYRPLTKQEASDYNGYLSAKIELDKTVKDSAVNRAGSLHDMMADDHKIAYGSSPMGGPVGPRGSVMKQAPTAAAGPVRVSSPEEAAKLPKGTRFVAPNGHVYVKN